MRHAAWTGVLVAMATAALLTGCGVESPDLFVLDRSGSIQGAELKLLVNDSGTVRCNGGQARTLPGQLLIASRELERGIDRDAQAHRRYPARRGEVLAYAIRSAQGTVRWADTSRPLPKRYFKLAYLARQIAQGPCGLTR